MLEDKRLSDISEVGVTARNTAEVTRTNPTRHCGPQCVTQPPIFAMPHLVRPKFEHTRSGVYFLLLKGVVVYVGQARNILVRLLSHAFGKNRTPKVFDDVAYIEVCEADLNQVEAILIEAFRPSQNGPRARGWLVNLSEAEKDRLRLIVSAQLADTVFNSLAESFEKPAANYGQSSACCPACGQPLPAPTSKRT